MSDKQNVAILSLGSELTQGYTLNTGSHLLAKEITDLGYHVALQMTLPDEDHIFLKFIKELLDSNIKTIIITGGLGPTSDDKTRELLAKMANVSLEYSEEAENSIKNFLKKRNIPYHQGNKVQALIPKGADWLINLDGTAPGIKMSWHDKTIFAVPGVPSETHSMFETHIKPYFIGTKESSWYVKEILFRGILEPELQKILEKIPFENSSWSSLPQRDGIKLRIFGNNQPDVEISYKTCLKEFQEIHNLSIISTNGDSLAKAIVSLLQEHHETLGTAESCTGGMVASEIISIPGSSSVINGGIVSYSNEIKHRILGVPAESLDTYGAVSEEVVKRMAEGAKRVLNCNWAIATSGIAGPEGGTEEKPVGLVWFAIASSTGTETFKKIFNGKRNEIREKSVLYILGKLFTKITQTSTCTFVQ